MIPPAELINLAGTFVYSDYKKEKIRLFFADLFMVHQTILELARVTPYAPQAYVSADSTTGACLSIIA